MTSDVPWTVWVLCGPRRIRQRQYTALGRAMTVAHDNLRWDAQAQAVILTRDQPWLDPLPDPRDREEAC